MKVFNLTLCLTAILVIEITIATAPVSVPIPPNVIYDGNAIPVFGFGGRWILRKQAKSIFAYAAGWSNCDESYFLDYMDDDTKLTYPSLTAFQESPFLVGVDAIIGDLDLFCSPTGNTNTSVYIPTYGLSLSNNKHWDASFNEWIYTYSANVQFRTTNRNGVRESTNDAWYFVGLFTNGRFVIRQIFEGLDGRVRRLQIPGTAGPGTTFGALQTLEGETFLGAWPPANNRSCLPGSVTSFC